MRVTHPWLAASNAAARSAATLGQLAALQTLLVPECPALTSLLGQLPAPTADPAAEAAKVTLRRGVGRISAPGLGSATLCSADCRAASHVRVWPGRRRPAAGAAQLSSQPPPPEGVCDQDAACLAAF